MLASNESVANDFSKRIALVTGATSGIGFATAADLGRRGTTVLVHGRTQGTADEAVRLLSGLPGTDTTRYVALHADLGSLEELRRLPGQVAKAAPDGLDVLINNAGAQFQNRQITAEGIEMTTAVVHLATAALCRQLLDDLRKAASRTGVPSQVVNVSSLNERFGQPVDDWSYTESYSQTRAYSNAKLMALAYTYALAEHVPAGEVSFAGADPGVVFTDFGRKAGGVAGVLDRVIRPVAPVLIASPEKAARRSVLRALAPDARPHAGAFYARGALRNSSKRSRDTSTIARVYARTEQQLDEFAL